MSKEEKKKQFEKLLKDCPEILSPLKVCRWTPLGKNRVYDLIRKKELPAIIFQGSYIVSKSDLIDYLVKVSEEPGKRKFSLSEKDKVGKAK